jgi:PPOX class probable F420-dependent enzyme
MPKLNAAARKLIESGALAHLVTLNPDGSPQVAVVWMGFDGDTLVSGHLAAGQLKLANIRRDRRVSVSFESGTKNPHGLHEHLIVHGHADVTEGGAPELLARLAKTYIAPDAVFPPMPNPPAGHIIRITITRIGGMGDWSEG